MRRALLSTFVLSALLSAARPATAAVLEGAVRTSDGAPVALVTVILRGSAGAQRAVTGPEGRYRFVDAPTGEHTVTVDAPGFVLEPAPRVTLGTQDTGLDLVLRPAPVREHVVVAATRTDAPLSTVGVSAGVLDEERIEARGATTVLELVQELPGLAVARAGGVGLQSSLFVRGGASNFARVLVDGVPVNEPGGAYNFGGELPLELERVEVVRGAASSLYGTDALAGVVSFATRRPTPGEDLGFSADAEAGSFDWQRARGAVSGRRGRYDWNAGLLRVETDNEQPNSRFEETSFAATAGAALGDATTVRAVIRAFDGNHGTPGPTAYGRPDLDAFFERRDLVLGAELRFAHGGGVHHLRAGLADSNQLSINPLDSGTYVPQAGDRIGGFPVSDFVNPDGFQNDTRRASLGYQAEIPAGRHLLVTGADLERETGDLGSRAEPLLSPERTNIGAYVQARLLAGDGIFLTLGGRLEHNDSFGTRAVPRGAVAWRLRGGDDATTLKASAGLGIKEPSFFESYGVSFFAQGNPDLDPERSTTFDAGVEQRLLGSRLRAEATLFHHTYRDQIAFRTIDFTTFQGTYLNLGKSRARGVEASLEAAPVPGLRVRGAYTFLDSEVLEATSDFNPVYAPGEELLRRPRHQGTLSVHGTAGRVEALATAFFVGERTDSDFVGIGLTRNPGYTRVDARMRVRLVGGLDAVLAADNLFDEEYEDILGYPALGRSLRAGLRFRSGGARP